MKEIESYAFSGCAGPAKVNIPKNVTQIDKDAFLKCSALKEISSFRNRWAIWDRRSLKHVRHWRRSHFLPEYCKWNRLQYFAGVQFPWKNATIPSAVTKLSDELFDGVS
ncbi:MAG: leucine-rich repeat protein [Blautia massiliensis (ex Durand et al. 2017)]